MIYDIKNVVKVSNFEEVIFSEKGDMEYLNQRHTPTNKRFGEADAFQRTEVKVVDRRKGGFHLSGAKCGVEVDIWISEGVQTKDGTYRMTAKGETLPEAVAREMYEQLRAYFEA